MSFDALLALEDGSLFYGTSIGIDGEAIGEVVFNTAITGYQEIVTDPSYYKQIVTLTHPHIGNVGTNPEDEESNNVFISGLVIRDLPLVVSNWRSTESLSDYLKRHNIVAISGIDTRQLTRHLRKNGAMKACVIAGSNIDSDKAVETAKSFAGLVGMDLAKEVTTKEAYTWNETTWDLEEGAKVNTDKKEFKVIAYDFGVKRNILRLLVDQGCDVTVVPAKTPAKDVLAKKPDGVFLSNGPGDPEPCDYAISAIKEIIETGIPVFGICLGHQLLADALDGEVGAGDETEVGIMQIHKTDAGKQSPFLNNMSETMDCLQWHGAEVKTAPTGFDVLSSSDACAIQSLSHGNQVITMQYHQEIINSTVSDWSAIPAYKAALEKALGDNAAEELEKQSLQYMDYFNKTARQFYENWKSVVF